MKLIAPLFLVSVSLVSFGQTNPKLQAKLDQQAKDIEPKLIEWRRHVHQFPELSNREVKTAAYIADHLKSLGLKVQTGIAKTGIVAILETGKPGPVIALRADIDALPVTERNSLPFASKETATYNSLPTGVMHACGHDSHIAILMSVAEILTKNKSDLKGIIKFIFQPAEEGAPLGEVGGADVMVKEGVLENPNAEVVFGMHIQSTMDVGKIGYKPGGFMAASDWFSIKVKGRQSHGASPWTSVDPIVTSAQIINGLQTIISRQTDLTKEAAVITVGRINAGIRENIIPEEATFAGTIRTLDKEMRTKIHEKIKLTATKIAESVGAVAEVYIEGKTPITYNDPTLTEKMVPSLKRAAGEGKATEIHAVTGAEDFACYQEKIPGLFFFVGAKPTDIEPGKIPSHHTPDFMLDERGFITGLKAMLAVTTDYMFMKK
ncbi:N-acyl-L-amino acid amidohydrolase [Cytophagales bacterium WSM2-2]|nr:N-acyl-L-amino acid amidohydrolase [Cytophagales bacterium WSM2-2]